MDDLARIWRILEELGGSCKIGRIRRNLEDSSNLARWFCEKPTLRARDGFGFLEDLARLGEFGGTWKIPPILQDDFAKNLHPLGARRLEFLEIFATLGEFGGICTIHPILQDGFAKNLHPPGARRLGFLEDLARLGEFGGTWKIGGTCKMILRKN